MQQVLAKEIDSQQSSDQYESISSEQQLNYARNQISFPSMPSQFANIYTIYTQSTQKIRKLNQKVSELEEKILELERCKFNKHTQEIEVQYLQDNSDESEFMIKYSKKCEMREKELDSLGQIYSGLKRLNSQANIFQDAKIAAAITKYIQSHRMTIAYKLIPNYILVLCRQVHYRKKHNLNMNALQILRSPSESSKSSNKKQKKSRSKDEIEESQQKEQTSYSLRLVNTSNLIHVLKPKDMVDFQGISDASQLEQIKQRAEKEVNIVRITKIHNKKSEIILATYSEQLKLFVVLDFNKKISVLDNKGATKSFVQLDKSDQVIVMELKKSELWVGTTEGILRAYSIDDGNLKLSRLFGCFYKQLSQVGSYLLIGESKVEKVVFSIHNNLYELSIANYSIKHVCEIAENIHYTIENYLVSQGQICKLIVGKDKYEISRNQKLSKWYYQYGPKNEQHRIVCIVEKEKQMQIIVGDTKGHLKVIQI